MITNYAQLQQAVIDKSHRNDLAHKVPDFIRTAEAKLYRAAPFLATVKVVAVNAVSGDYSLPLPADFMTTGEISEMTESGLQPLKYVPADAMTAPQRAARPDRYAIAGGKVVFNCFFDQARQYQLKYQGADYLSESNPTNWLLSSHPDIYLAAALFELATFTQDDVAAVYEAERNIGLKDLVRMDDFTHTMIQPAIYNPFPADRRGGR
jgi:hypothetical protein